MIKYHNAEISRDEVPETLAKQTYILYLPILVNQNELPYRKIVTGSRFYTTRGVVPTSRGILSNSIHRELWNVLTYPCPELNSLRPSDAYMRQKLTITGSVMAWRLAGAKPLSEPILEFYQFGHEEQTEILSEIHTFSFKKMRFKISSGKCLGFNVLI